MRRDQFSGAFLSAVFVDYDNIYLSLKRKSDEAAKRFAKDAAVWVKAIETGTLITPTNAPLAQGNRRIVMNRCYGNPVPRRNQADNSTDMSSFPFIRHHFLRSGFEIVDCPPLTAQLKNSSDIRMVMDVRDYLTHETYFDEFVILSGDADFTPVLHRLRAHARRTVIYANDYTAAPYTAISDGEIRESDLISLLLEGRVGNDVASAEIAARPDTAQIEQARRDILADVTANVRASAAPVPLEVLADRAIRNIGHDRTVGTGWGGAGGFRELLAQGLPEGMRVSGEPPYVVIDGARHIAQTQPAPVIAVQPVTPPAPIAPPIEQRAERLLSQPATHTMQQPPAPIMPAPVAAPIARETFAEPPRQREPQPVLPQVKSRQSPTLQQPIHQQQAPQFSPPQQLETAPTLNPIPRGRLAEPAPAAPQAQAPQRPIESQQTQIQQSIARIHEACQAPPLAPPEYRILFECMAQELNENGLIGAQTIHNITQRVQARGIEARRDDVRFVLEVVSEADPWFEQGASANLFAGRFRNFVVARCRGQGLNLSADELDLIEAWFAGGAPVSGSQNKSVQPQKIEPAAQQAPRAPVQDSRAAWPQEDQRSVQRPVPPQQQQADPNADDFPRIVRTRLRG